MTAVSLFCTQTLRSVSFTIVGWGCREQANRKQVYFA